MAFGLGIVLLPLSLLGVAAFGIGLLGLSPFLSGTVVGWRALENYRRASPDGRLPRFILGFVVFPLAAGINGCE
jgi:hypothetical protein